MKKSLKILLGVLSVLLVLTGCSSKDDADKNDKDGVVTLEVYREGDPSEDLDKIIDEVNKMSEEAIGVVVNMNYMAPGDAEEKMNVMINAGDDFDIATAKSYAVNAQKGAYADLTDLVEEHASEYFESIPDSYYDGNIVDGKLYGFPVNGNIFAQQVLTFNTEMAEKHDLDFSDVSSYLDAEPLLKVIKEKEPQTAPFIAIGSNFVATKGQYDYPLGDNMPFAIDVNGDGKTLVNVYETEDSMQVLKDMHHLYNEGLIPEDAATSTTQHSLEENTWFLREETQGPADYGDHLLTQVAKRPLDSQPITEGVISTSQAQMSNYIVATGSKYKEEAVQWLNFINTDPQAANTLIWGIEGEAWEKVDDEHIKPLDGWDDDSFSAWNTVNSDVLYQTVDVTEEMIEQREIDTENALESPLLGFTFDTNPVKTQLSNIANVMDEFSGVLNTGTVDPEKEVPVFLERLEEAGSKEVLEEMQSQFDEFLENQE